MPRPRTPAFHKILESILGSGKSGRPEVKWNAFRKLFEQQFEHDVEPRPDNIVHKFTPRQDTSSAVWRWPKKPFFVSKPSGGKFTPQDLNHLRSTFRTTYGWDSHTFTTVKPLPVTGSAAAERQPKVSASAGDEQSKDVVTTGEEPPEDGKPAAEEPRK